MFNQPLKSQYDLAIIGGGIHATSLAAEAASRGLSVLIVQANDLAAGASGGVPSVVSGELQRLENLNIFDISASLKDLRQVHRKAPGLITAQPIQLIDNPQVRASRWAKAGVAIYKKLFPFKDANPKAIISPVNAFPYSDFVVNRNRLILAYAQAAASRGAHLFNYCRIVSAEREPDIWQLSLRSTIAPHISLKTRCNILINSTGWQVNELMTSVLRTASRCRTTHVIAGRLILPRPKNFQGNFCFQRADKSMTYALKLNDNLVSIEPLIAENESEGAREKAVTEFLREWAGCFGAIEKSDIQFECWTKQAMPEDYANNREGTYADSLLDLNNPGKAAVLLNVFGLCPAKHRKLAEQALDILQPFTNAPRNPSYADELLPGAELFSEPNVSALCAKYPQIDVGLIDRLIKNYGARAELILAGRRSMSDLGSHFSHQLYAAEVDYLMDKEWVRCAEDILWRRTLLGLTFTTEHIALLDHHIAQNLSSPAPFVSAKR